MLTTYESFIAAIKYLESKGIKLEIKHGKNSYLDYNNNTYVFGEQIGVYLISENKSLEIVEGSINKYHFIKNGIKASYGIETL